jgi:hypothetical protein
MYFLDYDFAYMLTPVASACGIWQGFYTYSEYYRIWGVAVSKSWGTYQTLQYSAFLGWAQGLTLAAYFFEDFLIYGVMANFALNVTIAVLLRDYGSEVSEDWMAWIPTFTALAIDTYALLHYFMFASDDDMADDNDDAEDATEDDGSSSYGGYYYYY